MSTEAERTIAAYQRNAFNVDGWVVMYPSVEGGDGERGPLFVSINDGGGWGGGYLNTCTVFGTWKEAAKAAARIPYIMKQPTHLRRIMKLKIVNTFELVEDRPIELLDALAEL